MTYIERAIRDAVENGWGMRRDDWYWSESGDAKKIYRLGIFLDPLFWQALGKTRGWKGSVERIYNCSEPNEASVSTMKYACYQWHNLIDHLAEGKDAESFFEEIYKT